jgi:hypothetical protein
MNDGAAFSGSNNVQWDDPSFQKVKFEVGKLAAAIDRSTASGGEKKEAKLILDRITSNPLLVALLGRFISSGGSSYWFYSEVPT